MIALRPREFFEQHLLDSTFVKELPPSDAEVIGAAGEYIDYEENDVLFAEGDDADAMYFVVTGKILIFTDKDRTAEKELARLGPLAYFGEQGLLSINAGKRTASARPRKNASYQSVGRTDQEHPRASEQTRKTA